MIQQKIFNFDFEADYSTENFFVSRSNINAYKQILNNENSLNNILLKGPSKSGKTHLGLLWKKNNNAILFVLKNLYLNMILKLKIYLHV